jgi:hypothetical protein
MLSISLQTDHDSNATARTKNIRKIVHYEKVADNAKPIILVGDGPAIPAVKFRQSYHSFRTYQVMTIGCPFKYDPPALGVVISIFTVALATGVRDSSSAVEIIKMSVSVDHVVNRIVCWMQFESVEREAVWKRNWQTEEIKYLSGSGAIGVLSCFSSSQSVSVP